MSQILECKLGISAKSMMKMWCRLSSGASSFANKHEMVKNLLYWVEIKLEFDHVKPDESGRSICHWNILLCMHQSSQRRTKLGKKQLLGLCGSQFTCFLKHWGNIGLQCSSMISWPQPESFRDSPSLIFYVSLRNSHKEVAIFFKEDVQERCVWTAFFVGIWDASDILWISFRFR